MGLKVNESQFILHAYITLYCMIAPIPCLLWDLMNKSPSTNPTIFFSSNEIHDLPSNLYLKKHRDTFFLPFFLFLVSWNILKILRKKMKKIIRFFDFLNLYHDISPCWTYLIVQTSPFVSKMNFKIRKKR